MILLDTHFLSEFMRPAPAALVVAWLDAQAPDQVGVCAITRAEIELGVSLLPDRQRKRGLHLAATVMFTEEFAGRCLYFDEQAASRYASIVASRTRSGRPINVEDAKTASIELVHGLTLATRNESDFDLIEDLAVVNP